MGEKSENLDVDISAFLFGAKGKYLEAVGYCCPVSTDRGITHKNDSVQPEGGKIAEDIEFDLSLVHKRVSNKWQYRRTWNLRLSGASITPTCARVCGRGRRDYHSRGWRVLHSTWLLL